ncbi:hypothetical protein [Streptomyces sp. SID12488]|uniref:hypothetical protein n=1 Tax=Streptomyces sp. SID12488 TaxID=2706040 RepID=UPI0019410E97|nr:hypothetical protein [Streptomyces sp. SID12488]
MPDVRFRQAAVAGSAQAVGADVLGAGGFDAGAYRVLALPVLGALVETVALLDFMQFGGGQQRG